MTKYFKIFYNTLFFATLLPHLGSLPFVPNSFGGFNLSGYAWILCFLVSIFILTKGVKINFPRWIFASWVFYLFIYVILDFSFVGLQLVLQYVVPILVGYAASTFKYEKINLLFLIKRLKIIFLLISLIFILRFALGGRHIGADFVMLVVIMATLSLAFFFKFKKSKYLIYYALLSLIPLFLLTRMGIVMILLIFPLHFGLKNKGLKIVVLLVFMVVGSALFYSSAIQEKMFHSGSGTMEDIFISKENFNTSGRSYLASLMEDGLKENPVLGNGPRSDLSLFQSSGTWIMEAHNDYLSVRYNFGWVGLVLLLSSFLLLFIKLLRIKNKRLHPYVRVVLWTVLTLFIPLLGFMYSDNILKYSTSFGNIHMAMCGILFSILNKKSLNEQSVSV